MILEVVHPGGARTWHRLGGLPLSVGRGLTNDLILEDPYVDPQHARISIDEAGSPLIEDLGSVNGLVANDSRHRGRLSLQPGAEVRVGRTTLRFHDPAEPKTLMPRLRRLFSRARPTQTEVDLLRGVLAAVIEARADRAGRKRRA